MSVVIPAYNAESYLADAIDSVLSQTYGQIECIVVDDGSTDATGQVIEGYGNRVRPLAQENTGVSAARNLGIAEAVGEFVAFLDADDVWAPEKLERQLVPLRARPDIVFSYGGIELVDAQLRSLGAVPAYPQQEALERTLTLRPGGFHLAMTGIARKEAVVHLGGFDTRLSTCADADLALRLVDLGRASAVEGLLARYRQHGSQMHLGLPVFEHDWRIVLERASSLSSVAQERKLVRRAWAEFHWILGMAKWRKGMRRRALGHATTSLVRQPAVAWERTATRLGRA